MSNLLWLNISILMILCAYNYDKEVAHVTLLKQPFYLTSVALSDELVSELQNRERLQAHNEFLLEKIQNLSRLVFDYKFV